MHQVEQQAAERRCWPCPSPRQRMRMPPGHTAAPRRLQLLTVAAVVGVVIGVGGGRGAGGRVAAIASVAWRRAGIHEQAWEE